MYLSTDKFRTHADEAILWESNHNHSQSTSDDIRSSICKLNLKDVQAIRYNLRNLQDAFIVEHVLDQQPLQPYHAIASSLGDMLPHKDSNSSTKNPDWKKLVHLGLLQFKRHPKTYENPSIIESMNSRTYALAESALRLRELGYPCYVENGQPIFEDEIRLKIVDDIEVLIEKLGGLSLIRHLFTTQQSKFNNKLRRYLFPRHFDPKRKQPPSLPINFLIQLAVKQPHNVRPQPQQQKIWDELCELATCFASIYNVEPHSHWELMFQNVHTIREYAIDMMLYDQFFRFRQMRTCDVPNFLAGIFKWVTPEQERQIGFTITNAIQATTRILTKTEPKALNVFKKKDLLQQLVLDGIPLAQAARIIKCFTHQQPPNKNYQLPETPKTLDFFLRPIIKIAPRKLALVDQAMCAPAFYEAIASRLRVVDDQTQNKIGLASEKFIIKQLQKHGVTMLSGKYKYQNEGQNKGQGECDAILETDDTIVFFELKAKALTSASQSGQDTDIFIDLFKSLLKATSQAINHELVLRREGKITLEDGSQINLNGRDIEKVAVTLLDFGGLQDRTVIENIFLNLINAKLNNKKEEREEDYIKLNKQLTELRTQLEDLKPYYNPKQQTRPFFTCWFLSLPQLLILCDDCNSNEDFKNALWRTRHMSTQSLDWYTEHVHATLLKE